MIEMWLSHHADDMTSRRHEDTTRYVTNMLAYSIAATQQRLAAEAELERTEAEMAALRERDTDLRAALALAYRAMTEGMDDVPSEAIDPRCARLRHDAKREIVQAWSRWGDERSA